MAKGRVRSRVIYNDGARSRTGVMKFNEQQEELKKQYKSAAGQAVEQVAIIRCKANAVNCPYFDPGDETGNRCTYEKRCIYKRRDMVDGETGKDDSRAEG